MPLHADTIRAILNNWNATKYNGSQDVRPWLMEIEEKCRIYGIQGAQMTEVAVKCTEGEANLVLTAMFKAKVDKAGVWPWADFKKCLIGIEGKHNQLHQPGRWTPLTNFDRQLQAKYERSVSEIRQS